MQSLVMTYTGNTARVIMRHLPAVGQISRVLYISAVHERVQLRYPRKLCLLCCNIKSQIFCSVASSSSLGRPQNDIHHQFKQISRH